jgi:hypothetical protein
MADLPRLPEQLQLFYVDKAAAIRIRGEGSMGQQHRKKVKRMRKVRREKRQKEKAKALTVGRA